MRAPLAAAALTLLAAAACQAPRGRCDATADCAANERCDAGVCVRVPDPGGNGSGGGADPATFTPVAWSALAASPSARFAPSAVSADPASGDVLVSGAVDGRFEPWALSTGAFAARLVGASGGLAAAVPFPTFSHGALRTVSLAGGGLLFAGRAEAPTTLGGVTLVPPPAGTLVLGQLGPAGDPVWVVTVDGAGPSPAHAPVAIAARGADLVVAGTGAGDFGCGATAGATFAAALSGSDGSCLWSRGFANGALADVEARPAGDVAVAGRCAPTGAAFDLGGGASCTGGLYVAVLSGSTGATTWARTTGGTGTVTAVHDLSVAPDGSVAVVGDGRGALTFADGAAVDLGARDASFGAAYGADGALRFVSRPVEAPDAPLPDAATLDACAWDRSGRLWVAGRYHGQPTLGGVRFTRCRDACVTAAFLARLDGQAGAAPAVGSFLPVLVAASPSGAAFVDDLVLSATTGTVSWALRFSGDAAVGTARWTTDAPGLAAVRVVP